MFFDDSILRDAPVDEYGNPLPVLHDREYRVRAFRKADDLIVIRGAVRDQKPPGLYFADDPKPLTIHHMQIDLEVRLPTMEIVDATVRFETNPHEGCPAIVDHYGELVGLSIARGFTHRVRELFGGPRGCTHTTALLQAMAPVAVQTIWSMAAARANDSAGGESTGVASVSADPRAEMWKGNINTCHIWAEDGEHVAEIAAGGGLEAPVFARERMVELGLKPADWVSRFRG